MACPIQARAARASATHILRARPCARAQLITGRGFSQRRSLRAVVPSRSLQLTVVAGTIVASLVVAMVSWFSSLPPLLPHALLLHHYCRTICVDCAANRGVHAAFCSGWQALQPSSEGCNRCNAATRRDHRSTRMPARARATKACLSFVPHLSFSYHCCQTAAQLQQDKCTAYAFLSPNTPGPTASC